MNDETRNLPVTVASPPIRILLVDDQPERLGGIIDALGDAAVVKVRTPNEVSDSDLIGVHLVSVDEYLGDEWEQTVAASAVDLPVSMKNVDGLAVAASFRSQTRQSVRRSSLNFAVTLHTAELTKLAQGLPLRSQEPLTAAQHDLDWVFAFDETLGDRLVEMAKAVQSASRAAQSLSNDFGTSWLELPAVTWASTAREQIEDCRPPAHALAQNTDGRSYVRWLAQRILPYPTFLVNDEHASNLLGITVDSFHKVVQRIQTTDPTIQYSGPLSSFAGRRWWRAGWQQILVDSGANQWDSSQFRAMQLSESLGLGLTALSHDQPVVTYDLHGNLLEIDADSESAVRLQADGWPIYADDPWSLIEEVRQDADLVRLVALSDRDRITATS